VTAGGTWHDCGVRSDGSLWCWGVGTNGQLGINSTTTYATPQMVAASGYLPVVAAGYSHACALKTNGTAWCWGSNASGELGIGNTTQQLVPVQVGTAMNWTQLSAGGSHGTCGLRSDHSLWCWGNGTTAPVQLGTNAWSQLSLGDDHACAIGQVGDGTLVTRASPTQIGTSTWASVAAGAQFTCALDTAGAMSCWGENTNGQLGLGNAWTTAFQPVVTN
jgi:alpha-tubulin suppressor-like RCC1 family protein